MQAHPCILLWQPELESHSQRSSLRSCFPRDRDFVVVAAYRWQPGSTALSTLPAALAAQRAPRRSPPSPPSRCAARGAGTVRNRTCVYSLRGFGNGTKSSDPYRPALWRCSFRGAENSRVLVLASICVTAKDASTQRKFALIAVPDVGSHDSTGAMSQPDGRNSCPLRGSRLATNLGGLRRPLRLVATAILPRERAGETGAISMRSVWCSPTAHLAPDSSWLVEAPRIRIFPAKVCAISPLHESALAC